MPTATTGGVQQREAQTPESFMKQIEGDTLDLLMGVEKRQDARGQTLDQNMDKMEQNLQEAMQQKDERLKRARLKIIEADAVKLRDDVMKEEQDLAVAMVGLKELMDQIGIDYTELTKPSGDEQAIVTRAETVVKRAELDLAKAELELEQVSKTWFFRGRRMKAAQRVIDETRAGLDNAKAGLEAAKVDAQKRARARLMNATLDKSLQHYITQVGRVVDIMNRRQQAIDFQLNKVSARRVQALKMKQEASNRLEALDAQLTEMEQKLQLAEQELSQLTNGSAEYVAQETKVSELRNQVETVRGDRNTALAIYNSKERFAQELQIHETSQRKLRDNQRIWIAVLKSDTQERLITFASRLEAMKGMSDQQVAQGMDRIGTEIDGRNAEMMARVGATSDKVRQEMFEAQPERVARILSAMGAQAEAIAAIRDREQKAMESFRNRYGISPKAESFFSYNGEDGSQTAA